MPPRRGRPPRLRAAVALVCVAAATAACSGSGRGSSAPKHPSAQAAGVGGSSPTTSAAGGTSQAPCDSAGLRVAPGAGRAAAGTVVAVYTLTSTGPTACPMTGYPVVRLLGPGGAPIEARVSDGGSFFTNSRPTTVVLQPGGTASFLLTYASASPGSGCSTTQALSIAPPGYRGAVEVPTSLTVCPGARFSVSPVVAGSSPVG